MRRLHRPSEPPPRWLQATRHALLCSRKVSWHACIQAGISPATNNRGFMPSQPYATTGLTVRCRGRSYVASLRLRLMGAPELGRYIRPKRAFHLEGTMALKKCSECGEQISTKAAACPKCGAASKKRVRGRGLG